MRVLLRSSIVALLCVALGLGAVGTPAGAARRGEGPSREQLQRRADKAAARHERATAALGRLADEIAGLTRRIGAAEARLAPLRATVTRRAVALYASDRGLAALAGFTDGAGLMESARGAKLASEASAGDYAAIRAVTDVSAELARRRDELDARRAEEQEAIDDLAVERKKVEMALAQMNRRERALRSRLILRAERAEQVPSPSGAIPVATDFVCPVRGPVTFTDSWGAPRSGGRRHAGTDIMSPHGAPNVAVISGSFETHRSGAGGLSIYLHGDDGHTYYYAHLSQIVGPDRRVARGEVIGRTGSSGNASTPHTHFEFHPGGGRAVNSYSLLRAHC